MASTIPTQLLLQNEYLQKTKEVYKKGKNNVDADQFAVERGRMQSCNEKLPRSNKNKCGVKETNNANEKAHREEWPKGSLQRKDGQEEFERGKKWNENKIQDDVEGEDLLYDEEDEVGEEDVGVHESTREQDLMLQRYKDGIYIEIDMKHVKTPYIIDFHSECLNKYKEKDNFLYYQSYSLFNKKPSYLDDLNLLQMNGGTSTNNMNIVEADPNGNTVCESTHLNEANKSTSVDEMLERVPKINCETNARYNNKMNEKEATRNTCDSMCKKGKAHSQNSAGNSQFVGKQKERKECKGNNNVDSSAVGGMRENVSACSGPFTMADNKNSNNIVGREKGGNVNGDKENTSKYNAEKGSAEFGGSTDNTPSGKNINAAKIETETKGSSNGSPSGNELTIYNARNKNTHKNMSNFFSEEIRHLHFQKKKQESLDPLLKCINSLTDRINLQHLVGDPTSYFKVGGGDRYYDINDPFLDDDEMYKELNKTKNEIMLTKQIEDEYSVWSEELSEDFVEIDAVNFFSFYNYKCVFDLAKYGHQKIDYVSSSRKCFQGYLETDEMELEEEGSSSNSSFFSDETTHFLNDLELEDVERCTMQIFSSSSDSDLSSLDNNGTENKTNTSESTEEDIIFSPFSWKKFERRIPPEFIPIYEKLEKRLDALPLEVHVKKIKKIMKNGIIDIFLKITEKCKGSISVFGKNLNDLIEIDVKLLRWLTTTMTKMSNSLTDIDIYRIWFENVFYYNFKTFVYYEKEFVAKIKTSKIFEKHNTTSMNNILKGMTLWKNYNEKKEKMKREMGNNSNTSLLKGLTSNGSRGDKNKEKEKLRERQRKKSITKGGLVTTSSNKNNNNNNNSNTNAFSGTNSGPHLNKGMKQAQNKVLKQYKSVDNLALNALTQETDSNMKQTPIKRNATIDVCTVKSPVIEKSEDNTSGNRKLEKNLETMDMDVPVKKIGETNTMENKKGTENNPIILSENGELIETTTTEIIILEEDGSTGKNIIPVPLSNITQTSKDIIIQKKQGDIECINIDEIKIEDEKGTSEVCNDKMHNNWHSNNVNNCGNNNNNSSINNNDNNNNIIITIDSNYDNSINNNNNNDDDDKDMSSKKSTPTNIVGNSTSEKEKKGKETMQKKKDKKVDKKIDKLKRLYKYFKFFSDISKDILNYVKFYLKQKCLLKDMVSAGFEALIEVQNKLFVKSPYVILAEIFTNLFNFRYKTNICIIPEYIEGLVNYFQQVLNVEINVETGRSKKVFLFDTTEMNISNITYYKEKQEQFMKWRMLTSEEDASKMNGGGNSEKNKKKRETKMETNKEKKNNKNNNNNNNNTNATNKEQEGGGIKKSRNSRKSKTGKTGKTENAAKTDVEEICVDKRKGSGSIKKNKSNIKGKMQKKGTDALEENSENKIEKKKNERKPKTKKDVKEIEENAAKAKEKGKEKEKEKKVETNKLIESAGKQTEENAPGENKKDKKRNNGKAKKNTNANAKEKEKKEEQEQHVEQEKQEIKQTPKKDIFDGKKKEENKIKQNMSLVETEQRENSEIRKSAGENKNEKNKRTNQNVKKTQIKEKSEIEKEQNNEDGENKKEKNKVSTSSGRERKVQRKEISENKKGETLLEAEERNNNILMEKIYVQKYDYERNVASQSERAHVAQEKEMQQSKQFYKEHEEKENIYHKDITNENGNGNVKKMKEENEVGEKKKRKISTSKKEKEQQAHVADTTATEIEEKKVKSEKDGMNVNGYNKKTRNRTSTITNVEKEKCKINGKDVNVIVIDTEDQISIETNKKKENVIKEKEKDDAESEKQKYMTELKQTYINEIRTQHKGFAEEEIRNICVVKTENEKYPYTQQEVEKEKEEVTQNIETLKNKMEEESQKNKTVKKKKEIKEMIENKKDTELHNKDTNKISKTNEKKKKMKNSISSSEKEENGTDKYKDTFVILNENEEKVTDITVIGKEQNYSNMIENEKNELISITHEEANKKRNSQSPKTNFMITENESVCKNEVGKLGNSKSVNDLNNISSKNKLKNSSTTKKAGTPSNDERAKSQENQEKNSEENEKRDKETENGKTELAKNEIGSHEENSCYETTCASIQVTEEGSIPSPGTCKRRKTSKNSTDVTLPNKKKNLLEPIKKRKRASNDKSDSVACVKNDNIENSPTVSSDYVKMRKKCKSDDTSIMKETFVNAPVPAQSTDYENINRNFTKLPQEHQPQNQTSVYVIEDTPTENSITG